MKSIFTLTLLLTSFCCTGENKSTSFELSNGMKVVVLVNHRAPVIYHAVWYKVGSLDDPLLKSGLAHFSEHMMFKATRTRATGTFTKIAEQYGARYNASTSYHRTNYFETLDVNHLEHMMELEADRMVNLKLKRSEVNSEREVVLAERAQVIDTPPSSRLSEMGMSHYYLHHPYRIPVIGWKHEMETYSKADIRSFYNKWYAPNNAVLVLSGDITVEKAKTLAEKHYALIPAKPIIRANLPQEPNNHKITAQLSLRDKDFATPTLDLWFKSVSWKESLKKAYALEVLTYLLNGKTGLWYDTLVENEKVASFFKVDYHGNLFDVAPPLVISLVLPKGGDVEKAHLRVNTLIQQLLRETLKDEDLRLAKIKTTKFFDYVKENPTNYGSFVGEFLAKGFSLEDIESLRDEIDKVTKEDVMQMIQEIFSVSPRVVTIGLPEVIPEIVPEVIPEIVPEIIPEVTPEIIPEIVPEVIPEVVPKVIPEVPQLPEGPELPKAVKPGA